MISLNTDNHLKNSPNNPENLSLANTRSSDDCLTLASLLIASRDPYTADQGEVAEALGLSACSCLHSLHIQKAY
jgi:hypothetical protein